MLFWRFPYCNTTTIKRVRYLCTWIRVSKHLLISFNFACLRLSTLLFALVLFNFFFGGGGGGVVLWLRICVEMAVDRISTQTPLPPSLVFCFVPTLNSLFNTSDSYLVPLKLALGHLEVSRRASCQALKWDKIITIRIVCIVQYRYYASLNQALFDCCSLNLRISRLD